MLSFLDMYGGSFFLIFVSLLKKVLLLVADAMYDLPCLELPKIEFTICMYIKDII